MPIIPTYRCPECDYIVKPTLTAGQLDAPPPECPMCAKAADNGWKPAQVIDEALQGRLAQLECDVAMLQQAPVERDAAMLHPEKTSKTSNRAGAMSPKTKAVLRAVGAVLYGENRDQLPRDVRALAELLADRSQELGLAGCNDVDPATKLTTEAVRAVLEGMSAADRDASLLRSRRAR
jgi:hypothetical protein